MPTDTYSQKEFFNVLMNTDENDISIEYKNILTIMSFPTFSSSTYSFTQDEVNQLILKPGNTTDDLFDLLKSIRIRSDESESTYVDLCRKIMFGHNLEHPRIDFLKENIYLRKYSLLGSQSDLYERAFPEITFQEMKDLFSKRIQINDTILFDLTTTFNLNYLNNKEYYNFISDVFNDKNINLSYLEKQLSKSQNSEHLKNIMWVASHVDKPNVNKYYNQILNTKNINEQTKVDIEKIMLHAIVSKNDDKKTIKNRL